MENARTPATIWQWISRLLWYFIGTSASILLVATLAPRFLRVHEPWHFFLVGALWGGLVAAMNPLLVRRVKTRLSHNSAILLGFVMTTLITSIEVSVVILGVRLESAGIVTLTMSAVAYFLF